jgi:fructose-specific phosphotransferase system component IIB
MEYNLKTPVQVYNKDAGDYTEANVIEVEFKGRKGLKALLSVQDMITAQMIKLSKDTGGTVESKKTEKTEMTNDEIKSMIAMSGNSEGIFEAVLNKMPSFAKINGSTLSADLMDEMDIKDLEGLYEAVMSHFLYERVIRAL